MHCTCMVQCVRYVWSYTPLDKIACAKKIFLRDKQIDRRVNMREGRRSEDK